ncbi:helix-turn-helix domain-containing protein [Paenibacillus oryzisoli]|uniref:helix-turn-helix domain-containing protein n=1 Tax=Paenibacillus oryzisoli TaxID=1850517 RepID=UPI003D277743
MSADSILKQALQPYIRYADLLHYHNWRTPPRMVTDYMLLHVLEGEFRLQVEGGVHRVGAGQFSFVGPGVPHQLASDGHILFLALHMDWFPSDTDPKANMIVPLDSREDADAPGMQPSLRSFTDIAIPYVLETAGSEWLAGTLRKIVTHWQEKNAVDQLQAQLHATEIVLHLLKTYASHSTSESKRSTSLHWVPAYLQYRLSEPLSVEEMAHKALMSRSYFSEHFRQQFGMPPHQYLLKLRLDYATELLRSTVLPLQTIADSCGFSSVHHFSKMYRQRFGYAPSKVRAPN